jgi:hypothetical protein
MSAESATLSGRRAAEGLQSDRCTITRASTSAPVFNETTGTYTPAAPTTLYTGACRVKPRDNADRVVDAGGRAVSLYPYVVSVPVSAVAYAVDDIVTVTVSALDPALAGLVLRVRQPNVGSQVTARRLGCEVDGG